MLKMSWELPTPTSLTKISTDLSPHWKEKTSTSLSPAVLPKSEAQDQPQLPPQSQSFNKRKNNNLKSKQKNQNPKPSKKNKEVWEDFSIDPIQMYHYLNPIFPFSHIRLSLFDMKAYFINVLS